MEWAAHLIGPIPKNQQGQIDLAFLAMMSDGERRGKLDQGFYSMGVTVWISHTFRAIKKLCYLP